MLILQSEIVLDEEEASPAMQALVAFVPAAGLWWQSAPAASLAQTDILTAAIEGWLQTGQWLPLEPLAQAALAWRLRVAAGFVRGLDTTHKGQPVSRLPKWVADLSRRELLRWLLVDAAPCWSELAMEVQSWTAGFQPHWLASHPVATPPGKDWFAV
jgi:hypothetical protein